MKKHTLHKFIILPSKQDLDHTRLKAQFAATLIAYQGETGWIIAKNRYEGKNFVKDIFKYMKMIENTY